MVAWNFSPDHSPKGRAGAISKALCGYEAALPDTYGMKPQDLAALLNELIHRYANTSSASSEAGN